MQQLLPKISTRLIDLVYHTPLNIANSVMLIVELKMNEK
jgi:hypothetical protein